MAKMILVRRTIEVYGEEAAVRKQLELSWLKPGVPVPQAVRQEEVERVEFEVDEGYAKKFKKKYADRKREKQQ